MHILFVIRNKANFLDAGQINIGRIDVVTGNNLSRNFKACNLILIVSSCLAPNLTSSSRLLIRNDLIPISRLDVAGFHCLYAIQISLRLKYHALQKTGFNHQINCRLVAISNSITNYSTCSIFNFNNLQSRSFRNSRERYLSCSFTVINFAILYRQESRIESFYFFLFNHHSLRSTFAGCQSKLKSAFGFFSAQSISYIAISNRTDHRLAIRRSNGQYSLLFVKSH